MSEFSDKAKVIHKQMSVHLRKERKVQDFTMRALSERLGTPHSFIGKVENQGRRLDIAEFVLYCEGLGRDPIEVFTAMLAQK